MHWQENVFPFTEHTPSLRHGSESHGPKLKKNDPKNKMLKLNQPIAPYVPQLSLHFQAVLACLYLIKIHL